MNTPSSPENPIRVLLVDDDPSIRQLLPLALKSEPDLRIVATAADGSEVIDILNRHRIDVLLLDLQMANMDGIETISAITDHPRRPRIIVHTAFETTENVPASIHAGADSFLTKTTPIEQVAAAIRTVHAGQGVLSPSTTTQLLHHLHEQNHQEYLSAQELFDTLTPSEQKIAILVANDHTNKQIADLLYIGISTVKTHLTNISQKFGVPGRNGITRVTTLAGKHQLKEHS